MSKKIKEKMKTHLFKNKILKIDLFSKENDVYFDEVKDDREN